MFGAGTLAEEFLNDVEGFHGMTGRGAEKAVVVPRRVHRIACRLIFFGEPIEQSSHIAQVFRGRHQVGKELFLSLGRCGPCAFEIIGCVSSVPIIIIAGLDNHHLFGGIGGVAVAERGLQRGDAVVPFGIV